MQKKAKKNPGPGKKIGFPIAPNGQKSYYDLNWKERESYLE